MKLDHLQALMVLRAACTPVGDNLRHRLTGTPHGKALIAEAKTVLGEEVHTLLQRKRDEDGFAELYERCAERINRSVHKIGRQPVIDVLAKLRATRLSEVNSYDLTRLMDFLDQAESKHDAEKAAPLTVRNVSMYADVSPYGRACDKWWLRVEFSNGEVRKNIHPEREARALYNAILASLPQECQTC